MDTNSILGQCVYEETDRHEGIYANKKDFCQNLRDINNMCESVTRESKSWWTIDGGYCLPYSLAYQTLGLDTSSIDDNCAFSVKCALSINGLDRDCQCKNSTQCRQLVENSCEDWFLYYPKSGALLSPYIYMIYTLDHHWENKKPDEISYKGQVKCIGYQMIATGEASESAYETFKFYNYNTVQRRICLWNDGNGGNRNNSGPQYDINCWNTSQTFNHRPYQVTLLCEAKCLSKYRLRDGIDDCYWTTEYDEWSEEDTHNQ